MLRKEREGGTIERGTRMSIMEPAIFGDMSEVLLYLRLLLGVRAGLSIITF